MSQVPISVIILNHRHDERLAACLSSISFAKEVLVLDYESGVDWKKWQGKLPLTVVPKNGPLKDFSAARRESLLQAECDWVLFLDSDEVLEKNAPQYITEAIQNQTVVGFFIKRIDVFFNHEMKYGEVGNVKILRLVKKTAARFERPVHEIIEVAGPTALSLIKVHHYAHLSITEFLSKVARYAEIEAMFREKYSFARLLFELLVFPPGKFIFNYFFKLGFMDGMHGLLYAVMMSLHSVLVRVFAYEKLERN